MPTLKQSVNMRRRDMERLEPMAQPAAGQFQMQPPIESNPGIFTICPLPLVVAYPDGLRQFYRSGIPQIRVLPPK